MTTWGALLSPRVWLHLLLLRPLLRLLFGVIVEGRDNLAGHERFVIAANHNSHLDVLLLFGVLPVQKIPRTRPVAAGDYFGRRPVLYRVVDYLFRPIWIVRGEKSDDAMRAMSRIFSGDTLPLFFTNSHSVFFTFATGANIGSLLRETYVWQASAHKPQRTHVSR